MRVDSVWRMKISWWLFGMFLLMTIVPNIVTAEEKPATSQPTPIVLETGAGSFVFHDAKGNTDKPLTIWYYKPEKFSSSSRILFAMHGDDRNAVRQRELWAPHADRYNFLVIAPEFSQEHYPSAWSYHHGNVPNNPVEKWSFTAIEHLFDEILSATGNRSKGYYLFGHSAGAQFVHRLILFKNDARVLKAVAANAGWYTMPTFKVHYPAGLDASHATEDSLKTSFRKRLIVLLGDLDRDENAPGLPKSREAMAQGKHRLERGENFLRTARLEAKELETPISWGIRKVPKVGHSSRQMIGPAAIELFRN